MMKKVILMTALVVVAASSQAVVTGSLSPNINFGGGDGWLAPGENGGLLASGDGARGMAFNPTNGNIYIASTAGGNAIRVLNSTGTEIRTLDLTGVTGGDRVLNKIGVANDGRIYVSNLRVTQTLANTLKVYTWATDAAAIAPTLAFSGSPLIGGRIGDSMDVTGSGANTSIAFGYGSAPAVAGNNGYAILNNASGSFLGNHFGFAGPTPAAGDHRLGITFIGPNNILGGQNSNTRRSTYTLGGSATFDGTTALSLPTPNNQRAYDYAVIDGVPVLVTMDSGTTGVTRDVMGNPTGNLSVRLWNVTDWNAPTLLATNVIPTSGNANGNGVGEIKFGAISGKNATIYALSTNNGIQSFNVEVVPEPASMLAIGAGLAALAGRKRRKA